MGSRGWSIDSCRSQWPWKVEHEVKIIWQMSIIVRKWFDLEWSNFARYKNTCGGDAYFWAFSHIHVGGHQLLSTVWLRATKFGVIKRGATARFWVVSETRVPRRQRPTCVHRVWDRADELCTVMRLGVRTILHGWPRILTRELFAVANLVHQCRLT